MKAEENENEQSRLEIVVSTEILLEEHRHLVRATDWRLSWAGVSSWVVIMETGMKEEEVEQ